MNVDSLVNNAFFVSTSQRNPYKVVSQKRRGRDGVNDKLDSIKIVATKKTDLVIAKMDTEQTFQSPVTRFDESHDRSSKLFAKERRLAPEEKIAERSESPTHQHSAIRSSIDAENEREAKDEVADLMYRSEKINDFIKNLTSQKTSGK